MQGCGVVCVSEVDWEVRLEREVAGSGDLGKGEGFGGCCYSLRDAEGVVAE